MRSSPSPLGGWTSPNAPEPPRRKRVQMKAQTKKKSVIPTLAAIRPLRPATPPYLPGGFGVSLDNSAPVGREATVKPRRSVTPPQLSLIHTLKPQLFSKHLEPKDVASWGSTRRNEFSPAFPLSNLERVQGQVMISKATPLLFEPVQATQEEARGESAEKITDPQAEANSAEEIQMAPYVPPMTPPTVLDSYYKLHSPGPQRPPSNPGAHWKPQRRKQGTDRRVIPEEFPTGPDSREPWKQGHNLTVGYMSPFHASDTGVMLPADRLAIKSPPTGSCMNLGHSLVSFPLVCHRGGPDYTLAKPHRNMVKISEWAPRVNWAQEEPWRRRRAQLLEDLSSARCESS